MAERGRRALAYVLAPASGAVAIAALVVAHPAPAQEVIGVPEWAYLTKPAAYKPKPDDGRPRHVPGSAAGYLLTQLRDPFLAPDWHPGEHPAMPEVVRQGRKPDVFACGFCHRATGTGGPENADVAGLPYEYIVRQIREFKSGARTNAVPDRAPSAFMVAAAKAVTDAELEAAAAYYSAIKPRMRMHVQESANVPKTTVAGWVFAAAPGGGTEPLGRRIIEMPMDLEQFEARDPHAQFIAYVPPGSVARGEALVATGAGVTVACAACHGAALKGSVDIPPIAGRSPTYVLRQLYDFKAGLRRGTKADQMRPTVAQLSLDDMIAIAAYLATREP